MKNKMTVSELEKRGQAAAELLKAAQAAGGITVRVADDLSVVVEKAGGALTTKDNQIIVSMEKKDIVQGSQKMLALGQGVRAKTAKSKEGKTVVEAYYFDRDKFNEEK